MMEIWKILLVGNKKSLAMFLKRSAMIRFSTWCPTREHDQLGCWYSVPERDDKDPREQQMRRGNRLEIFGK